MKDNGGPHKHPLQWTGAAGMTPIGRLYIALRAGGRRCQVIHAHASKDFSGEKFSSVQDFRRETYLWAADIWDRVVNAWGLLSDGSPLRIISGFSDHRSSVGVADENRRAFLRCKDTPGNCYVVLQ
jgi:hypothetical protein